MKTRIKQQTKLMGTDLETNLKYICDIVRKADKTMYISSFYVTYDELLIEGYSK